MEKMSVLSKELLEACVPGVLEFGNLRWAPGTVRQRGVQELPLAALAIARSEGLQGVLGFVWEAQGGFEDLSGRKASDLHFWSTTLVAGSRCRVGQSDLVAPSQVLWGCQGGRGGCGCQDLHPAAAWL